MSLLIVGDDRGAGIDTKRFQALKPTSYQGLKPLPNNQSRLKTTTNLGFT